MGKVVKMEARLSGSQPISVSWFKDGSQIHSSDKHDVSLRNNTALLAIKDTLVFDQGRYSCEATNEAGKESFQVSLTISGVYVFKLNTVGFHSHIIFIIECKTYSPPLFTVVTFFNLPY